MRTVKWAILSATGGMLYYCIEMLWRGYSHWTMTVLGGLCFLIIGGINEYFSWDMPIGLQGVIGSVVITSLEFSAGCVLNVWLGLGIWDYSEIPLNIFGQVCLPYSLLWIPLSIVAVVVDDYLRFLLFQEERPRYTWW